MPTFKDVPTEGFPLATAEWLAEHCPPFTCPPKVAALVAKKRARQEQEQDPAEPSDEHPKE